MAETARENLDRIFNAGGMLPRGRRHLGPRGTGRSKACALSLGEPLVLAGRDVISL